MQAAWYEDLGPADDVLKLGELPAPTAGPGEVRVRLFASGVNPSDVKRRSGQSLEGFRREYPRVIPNSDGAGVVDQVGSGVSEAWLGQRVWIYNGQRLGRPFGTAAEFIALSADLVTPLPDSTSFAEGACLGIPAMTAHRCVFADGPVTGRTVLVTGGAGAVGHYAIQLAKWGGARVIATVSSAEKAAAARAAGADAVIDYRREAVVERVMAESGGAGVERIVEVDFGGNLEVSLAVVRPGGAIASYASYGNHRPVLPFYPLMVKNVVLRLVAVSGMPVAARDQACRDLTRWLGEATAVHNVAACFPLREIAAAHKLVESGAKIGTVVVEPNRPLAR
ncbi:MAG: NADPH:quinone reductase [Alphaproteobacteria bacterium]|nr:NADPH:quinone reductase [Alphaproteobacteria bacterium]